MRVEPMSETPQREDGGRLPLVLAVIFLLVMLWAVVAALWPTAR